MLILHVHWQPPLTPSETGGILFWAETGDAELPAGQRGRLAKNPKPKNHPFCAPIPELRSATGLTGKESAATLRLPTTRTGPLPSPELSHAWEQDKETPPSLAPWIVDGIWLASDEAVPALLRISASGPESKTHFGFGASFHFWSRAAALVLETLAAHKLLPVLVPADADGKIFHARWLPVLDSPHDSQRLAQLEAAMPPVCRAQVFSEEENLSPRSLLNSFLNTTCDALARQWGKPASPLSSRGEDALAYRWIEALFSQNPAVQASPAQLQSLASSHRAWMRNLHIAGDAAFRIAFRIETPALQTDAWQLHYLLQASDDPSLLVPAEQVWKKTGSIMSKLGRKFENPQEKLLAGLGYVARLFPPVTESLKNKRPSTLELDAQGAYTFLRETAPILEGAGFGLLVPPWWNRPGARLGLKVKMKSQKGKDAVAKGLMTLEKLVSYEWQLSLGGTSLTEQEFQALAALKSPLVQVRGQWVTLDPGQIEAALQFWEKQQTTGEIGMLEALQFSLGGETEKSGLPIEEVIPEGWLAEWLERFSASGKMSELPQPAGLHGELRPYQLFGYSWLSFHRQWGLGACLADDMGLGKTIQMIALLLQEKETRANGQTSAPAAPALLVCPTSVVTNWQRELERFAPGLNTYVHRGTDRLRGGAFRKAVRGMDVVMTSYPLMRLDAETIQSMPWLAVILDEAQNIKNPSAQQTQAVRKVQSEFRVALTGTPVENRLSELWSIMHFLNPGYLGTREKFRSSFAMPIERYQDKQALDQLKQMVNPFILRRVKTDPRVISDLPAKVETKVYCSLTEEQATLYEAVVKDVMKRIEEKEGIERRGLVLSMLMQLKQICNHPVQYLHQTGKDAAESALEGRSGKLARLQELLEEVLAEGDRSLIFTQFAEMGALLAAFLPKSTGAATQFLHGGTPVKMRDQMVSRFQEDEHAPPIFILSIKAGGTGLNLTRANHVFHFDRWWNPAVEDQATDRAFRIGQKRNVQVHKFVTTGTLEEMIDDMIESKKGLAQAVVGSGESWLTELSTDELRNLVMLRRE